MGRYAISYCKLILAVLQLRPGIDESYYCLMLLFKFMGLLLRVEGDAKEVGVVFVTLLLLACFVNCTKGVGRI